MSLVGLPLQELQSDCCVIFLTLQPNCRFLRAERWCQRIRIDRSLSRAKMGLNALKFYKLHSKYLVSWSDIDILSKSIQYFAMNIWEFTNFLHLFAMHKFIWKIQIWIPIKKQCFISVEDFFWCPNRSDVSWRPTGLPGAYGRTNVKAANYFNTLKLISSSMGIILFCSKPEWIDRNLMKYSKASSQHRTSSDGDQRIRTDQKLSHAKTVPNASEVLWTILR